MGVLIELDYEFLVSLGWASRVPAAYVESIWGPAFGPSPRVLEVVRARVERGAIDLDEELLAFMSDQPGGKAWIDTLNEDGTL